VLFLLLRRPDCDDEVGYRLSLTGVGNVVFISSDAQSDVASLEPARDPGGHQIRFTLANKPDLRVFVMTNGFVGCARGLP